MSIHSAIEEPESDPIPGKSPDFEPESLIYPRPPSHRRAPHPVKTPKPTIPTQATQMHPCPECLHVTLTGNWDEGELWQVCDRCGAIVSVEYAAVIRPVQPAELSARTFGPGYDDRDTEHASRVSKLLQQRHTVQSSPTYRAGISVEKRG